MEERGGGGEEEGRGGRGSGREKRGGRGDEEVGKLAAYLLLVALVVSTCSLATVPSIRDVLRHTDNYVTVPCVAQ